MDFKIIMMVLIQIASAMPLFVKAQTFSYEIKGEIKGLGNDTLELTVMQSANNTPVKLTAANNKFDYKSTANGHWVVFAQVLDKRRNGDFTFFVDKGVITIGGDVNALDDVQVTGTPINDEYAAGSKLEGIFYKKRDSIYKKAKEFDKSSLEYKQSMASVDSVMELLQVFRVNYVQQHPASLFGAMQLYLIQDDIPVEQLEKLYLDLRAPAKELGLLKDLPERIAAKKVSETGSVAPNFVLKDMNGKLIDLSDYRGNYVLLDFWASWCVPCREESAGLVKTYKAFKGKQFEIISVSSDMKETNWRKAIQDDKLGDWINICDFKGLTNQIATEYGVQPIPDNFLIDPDGKIIARHIVGEELIEKLRSLLKDN